MSVSDVECSACGGEEFRLRRVEEYETLTDAIVAFCAACGTAAAKYAVLEEGFQAVAERVSERSELSQRAYENGRDAADLPD